MSTETLAPEAVAQARERLAGMNLGAMTDAAQPAGSIHEYSVTAKDGGLTPFDAPQKPARAPRRDKGTTWAPKPEPAQQQAGTGLHPNQIAHIDALVQNMRDAHGALVAATDAHTSAQAAYYRYLDEITIKQ